MVRPPTGDVTAWLTLAGKYGFAGLVAGVLLYVFVIDVRVAQSALQKEHAHLSQGMTAVVDIAGQSDMAMQKVLYVLQTMCVNAARNDEQRRDCLRTIEAGTR